MGETGMCPRQVDNQDRFYAEGAEGAGLEPEPIASVALVVNQASRLGISPSDAEGDDMGRRAVPEARGRSWRELSTHSLPIVVA